MKAVLALVVSIFTFFLCASQAQAQANAANYTFSTTMTGSLTDMSSGTTLLITADQDDTASAVTLLGFDFYFMGVRQDRFSVNSNGLLRFGATAVSNTAYDPLAQSGQSLVTAYGADQRTHVGDGKVHFKLTGAAPNRVLVVEWRNMQADFNAAGTANLSYQVHLSETTGNIEFIYGAMSMSAAGAADPNSQSPQFGFSSGNTVGTVGSITAAQSGTPTPSFSGAAATPVNNTYAAGAIPALTSAADGARRTFLFSPIVVNPPGGPLTFTAVSATAMTLNWTDSSNELGYVIYSSTDGVNFSFVNTVAQNTSSFAATGLFGSTTYYWRVYALTEGSVDFITGSQATTAPVVNISQGSGLWSAPGTWSTGSVPTSEDAVSITAGTTVTIDTASAAYSVAVLNGATLQFEQTSARSLVVATDLAIDAGGTIQSNPAGTQTGHVLSLGRNLTNNGTLDFSTNADTAGAGITFTSANNATFSGSGAITNIRQITVNKGTTAAPLVELMPTHFTVRGTTTDTVVVGWLVVTNGTIKISGTFSGTSRVFSAATYIIPATAGFWLNNPNYTVAGQTGNGTNNGMLRISAGSFNIGTASGNSLILGIGSTTLIEGGAVNATGRFGVAAAANTINYTQTGGTITVCTIGNTSATVGSFDLGTAVNSNIAMSGGTIVNQISATAIDYRMQSGGGVASVTGGTLQIGNSLSGAAKTFNLRGVLPNLVVTNTSGNHTAAMSTTLVNFNNIARNVTINAGNTFNIGNAIFLMAGTSLINDGILTASGANSNLVWYDLGSASAQTYSGGGVSTAPITAMSLQNTGGLILSATNPVTVNRLNLYYGGVTNANMLTIGNGGATTGIIQLGVTGATQTVGSLDVGPAFNPGTGGVQLYYAPELTGRTTGNEVPPSRTLSLLSVTNPNDVTIAGGDLTITGTSAGALALSGGRVITGANTLFFNSAAGTVTRTTGYVDGNFKKSLAAASNVTFELGTANGYTPVIFNATGGSFPAEVTVAAIQATVPGIQPASKAISRYWNVTAPGLTADLTFSYLDPVDIPGTVTEANLHFLRHESGNPADFSDQGGTINTAANTATLTGISSFSTWTLAEANANLAITVTDGSVTAIPGGSVTYTITASNGGTVANPAAVVTDTFPAGLTCSTTCVGTLGASCTAGPFAGNINDSANIPSGAAVTYTASCLIAPNFTGSLVNTATVSGGAITDDDTSNNSATDADTLIPNADLAVTATDGITTATPGGSVTYTITASNAGPSDATGAAVADSFPAALTCTWTCAGAGGGTCTAAGSGNLNDTVNLPVGTSVTYTASCTISGAATGTLSNTVIVAAPGGVTDPAPGNNTATDSDTLTPQADLAVTVTDGLSTVTAGASLTYTITASNAGPSIATGATVTDTFPAVLTCTWTCAGAGGGSCTAAGSGNLNDTVNLPAGGSVTYTASCTISGAATGTLSNTATVAAPGGVTDPSPGNNSAMDSDTLSSQADLAITATDGVTTAHPGGSVTYTITASNAGPSNATGATVADTFPAVLTCTWTCAGAGGGTCTAAGSGNLNDTVNLPAGGSVTYTASCTISGAATGTLSNTATVAAPGGVTDHAPGNNSATDADTLSAPLGATLTGTMTVAGSFLVGSNVVYTVTLTNNGTGAQADNPGNEFTDALSPQLSLVSATATSGTAVASVGINTVTWDGPIPAGGSVTITIVATILPARPGTSINNQGTIAFDSDGDGTNDAAAQTSNPAVPGPAGATGFQIAGVSVIPTLSPVGILLLIAMMAALSLVIRKRQR